MVVIFPYKNTTCILINKDHNYTIAHPWHDSHSICISVCGVWGVKVGVQVSSGEFHTLIYLGYVRVQILYDFHIK